MPSRIERRRWSVRAVAGLAVWLASVMPSPAATNRESWVRVVAEDDAGIELVLTAPEPEISTEGLRVPGFGGAGQPGDPEWFEGSVTLAVPGRAGARLDIVSSLERDLGSVPRRILPAPVPTVERATAGSPEWRAVAARPLEGPVPARTVELSGVAGLREYDVVFLHFRPVQFRTDGGATFTSQVRVRIRYADRVRHRAAPVEEPLLEALLNGSAAATWEPVLYPAAPRGRVAALPAQRLRIRIPARGLYDLSYADLLGAGVPVNQPNFDSRTLRLFFDCWKTVALSPDSIPASWQSGYEMQEASLWVDGDPNGSFTPTDRLVFYALGPEGYEDLAGATSDSLAYFRHPYDRNAYAWLTWDAEFGQRMQTASVAAPDTTVAPVVRSVVHREHREEDHTYDAVDDLWYWDQIRSTHPVTRTLDALDLGGPASTPGTMRVALGYPPRRGNAHHIVDILLDGSLIGTADWTTFTGEAQRFSFPVTVVSSPTVQLRDGPGDLSDGTDLLEIDFTYPRPLRANTARVLSWSTTAAGPTIYELAGFDTQVPLAFDVSDPLHPIRLLDPTPAGSGVTTVWRLLVQASGGPRGHFMAVRSASDVPPRDLALRTVASLRERTTSPDMVIVTDSSLRPAAEALAAYRRAHYPGMSNPDIQVVNTIDIYENFSGGRVDPLAIRNYVKFLYDLESPPRLRYLLLFGDGNYDVRQILASSPPSFVPPFEPGYTDPRFVWQGAAYAVEDWFVEMNTPGSGTAPYPVPDLAVGRIAARNLAEGQRIVDKLVAYETTSGFGPWRARLLMTADDECHPGNCTETYHIGNTESLCDSVPVDLDIVKFYETEYPDQLGQKPQARSAFIRQWSEGCVLLNYQGHGAPRQLTDEVLFVSSDIPSLTNGSKLPLFLPISCTVSEFDVPDRQSMCEDLVASPGGGAIATIGATTPTYVYPNFNFNTLIITHLFSGGANSRVPVGLVHQLSKVNGVRGDGSYNETYMLLGDPSMSLMLPQALVLFTSGADTLDTGNRARVEGEVVSPTDSTRLAGFAGQIEVEVRGSDDTSGYRRSSPPNIYIPYNLPGAPLYRGLVPVTDGRFAFDFIVPVEARIGELGRVSGYALSSSMDARGEVEDVVVRYAVPSDTSSSNPRISLRFPNDRTRIKAGTPLTAEIRDENGINIQGTSPLNSIRLDFDRRNEPLNVTDQFRYAAGSDSVGNLTVPIPSDLDPGTHAATLIASDNLLNVGTASIEFQVVDEQIVQLVNVLAFPNPFRDWTRFFFEITDPADVEVQVFTTSGREVWHTRQRFDAGTQGSIKWDGVDLREDTLANGTYIYRLRARPDRPGTPALEHIGKVVIMR